MKRNVTGCRRSEEQEKRKRPGGIYKEGRERVKIKARKEATSEEGRGAVGVGGIRTVHDRLQSPPNHYQPKATSPTPIPLLPAGP